MEGQTYNKQMHTTGYMKESAANGTDVASTSYVKNAQDQINSTHEYVQRHHLNELFAHLMQLVLYYQPENPREFLSNEIKRIREQKVSTSLFTERDLETMFDIMDVTKQQWITVQQLRNTCKNLAATNNSSNSPTNTTTGNVSKLSSAQEEAIAKAADANGHVSLDKFK